MNQKYRVIFPLMLLLFFCCGCSRQETEEEAGYMIYYNTPGGAQLQSSSYIPTAQTFDEIMEELAGKLAEAPAGFESVLKDGVIIQGYQRGIDALRIDFSSEYYDLDNVDEVLLRAAVVKTFSQVPGVTRVMITVDGGQLVDDEGEPVPAMDREDFINTKEGGINSYQYAALSLYFVDAASGKLSKEIRNLHYSSNMVLENVVTEQLIQGPENSELVPVFVDTVKILSVHVQDGICVVDFDSTVNQRPAECTAGARTALYALVNSICDTCDEVEGVRIRINGESDTVFRDEIPLNQVFYMELSEVESYTEADSSTGVFALPETQSQGEGSDADEAEGEGGETADARAEALTESNPTENDGEAETEDTQKIAGVSQEQGADGDLADPEEDASQQADGTADEMQQADGEEPQQADDPADGDSDQENGNQNGGVVVGVDPALAGQ